MDSGQKLLDISTFICEIERILRDKIVISGNQARFYGEISVHFEDGKRVTIRRNETIK